MNVYDPKTPCPRCGCSAIADFCASTNNCGTDHDTPLQHRLCMWCGTRWNELPRQEDIDAYNAWLIEVNKR